MAAHAGTRYTKIRSHHHEGLPDSAPPQIIRLVSRETLIVDTPYTPWQILVGISKIRAALVARAHVAGGSSLVSRLRMQTAAVRPDEPDPWTDVMDGQSVALEITGATDSCTVDVDIATALADKMYARFGVGTKMTATGAPAMADVGLAISALAAGRVVANWTGTVVATSSTALFTPISEFEAATRIASFLGTLQAFSPGANVEVKLAWRTAEWSTGQVGSWNVFGSGVSSGTPDRVITHTPSLGNNFFVQLGVAAALTGGATTPVSTQVRAVVGLVHG